MSGSETDAHPEGPQGPGSLQPGAKGTVGVDEKDTANTLPTPEPGTEPMHEGGP